MKSKEVGTFGEKIAENYLKKRGYQILDRNYFLKIRGGLKKGEIDIIAKKSGIISFIEVKTLKNDTGQTCVILPEEKVNYSKKRKLRIVAESWLREKKIPLESKWQIDVISIRINLENKKAKIRHFLNI